MERPSAKGWQGRGPDYNVMIEAGQLYWLSVLAAVGVRIRGGEGDYQRMTKASPKVPGVTGTNCALSWSLATLTFRKP